MWATQVAHMHADSVDLHKRFRNYKVEKRIAMAGYLVNPWTYTTTGSMPLDIVA